LNRGNQVILDGLAPKVTPSGSLGMVILSCLPKAALDQCHSAAAIALRLDGVRLLPSPKKELVAIGPGYHWGEGTLGCLRALRANSADRAGLGLRSINPALLVLVISAATECLACWAAERVCIGVVHRFRRVKNAMLFSHSL